MTLRLGSLFSGYGGLDLAVHQVFGDVETAWVSDIEPGPCKVLAHRFPGVPNLGDITAVDWSQVEPVDIIAGGSGTKGGPNQRGSSGDLMLPSAVMQLLPTPSVADATGGHERRGGKRGDELLLKGIATHQAWGPYTAAIARWEAIHGPAPAPTKPGRTGRHKLNPAFAEWMMGAPAGWITDTPGVTDNEALRMAGNGVVRQQAVAAMRLMLNRMETPT